LASRLEELAPSIAASLVDKGYYTTGDGHGHGDAHKNETTESSALLDRSVMETLRAQAIALRNEDGRYQQSWSESISSESGQVTRFDKPGVFACEPDGADYDTAPDLITYMSILITTLPPALNIHLPTSTTSIASISNQAFNAKLAVTESHSEYPLHVDNSRGMNSNRIAGEDHLDPDHDTRKLTCILYLNPDYDREQHRGELRVHLLDEPHYVDLEPSTRFVCFWTDEIPHKVLMTGHSRGDGDGDGDDNNNNTMEYDRYALTIWLADDEPAKHIHNLNSKFAKLRVQAFDNAK
jgi:hypothetical protein